MIIVDQDNALPHKRQLCNYYFIIIDQVDILFGDRLTVTIHGGDINIHASRNLYTEESCIAESCIAEIMHRGIMHRGNHASRVINYARREDFMPRQNLCIARRLHTSLEFIHREKNLCLAGIRASRKSCIAESCIASQ